MREVSRQKLVKRIRLENPWWELGTIDAEVRKMRPRAYLRLFLRLAKLAEPHRALLLMGPRCVGKTWLIYHAIQSLIDDGRNPKHLCYVNVQTPLYNGLSLEDLVTLACEASGAGLQERLFICFDEIQYLRNWEIHLKTLVDTHRSVKFVASGSAAAALKLKSTESGAGRFTDFLLPPLTFYEYLDLKNESELVTITQSGSRPEFSTRAIDELNERFIQYLNFGGYPEVVFSRSIQLDPGRFVRGDIIDKVLMKDLPSLYGIQDVQELNSLFQNLTYNTGGEVSLEHLSQRSGVAKNTIKRYIEYLESAFLIKIVHRVDRSAKRFQRATRFKVYVTNPSLYCALFSPVGADDEEIGCLVETAVFAQWFHSSLVQLYYARWNDGEVDIVNLDANLEPRWAVEVKWSDSQPEDPGEIGGLVRFCNEHPQFAASVTTRTVTDHKAFGGCEVDMLPASLYCFILGYNIISTEEGRRSAVTRG